MRKIQVKRLDKDELEYELKIRGIQLGIVDEMRSRLSAALRLEQTGDSFKYPAYSFTFDEDATAASVKCQDIKVSLDQLVPGPASSLTIKLDTKFAHLLGRLDNMDPGDDNTKKDRKSSLLAEALGLLNAFQEKVTVPPSPQVPAALSLITAGLSNHSFQLGLAGAQSSSPVQASQISNVPPCIPSASKMIPPHKWGIEKFSGAPKSLSVNAFFEMVEELRVARNVSKDVMLDSGLDLFVGKAYQFYKDTRLRVSSWDEMVEEFRQEYLSANHNDILLDELRRRTQHPMESIGVYLAVMSSYFGRLRCLVPEEAKLAIILQNLHPFYQDRLRDPMPSTIEELRIMCRRMEDRRDAINSYVEPSGKKINCLEQDLAYVDFPSNASVDEVVSTPSSGVPKGVQCFRCGQVGHRAIGCALPRNLKCYGCKREGFTVKTCPTCSRKGN